MAGTRASDPERMFHGKAEDVDGSFLLPRHRFQY